MIKMVLFSKRTSVTKLDLFTALNSILFLLMCICFYTDRYTMFHGKGNIHEFFLYSVAIFSVIFYAWLKLRTMELKIYILVLIESAIILHFAGGFLEINGGRLYDFNILFIRYDQLVHMINSLFAALVFLYLFKKNNFVISEFVCIITVCSVLGLGAAIEILEFIVSLTVDNNGVGTYVNNMNDMVANFIGAVIGIGCYRTYNLYKKNS